MIKRFMTDYGYSLALRKNTFSGRLFTENDKDQFIVFKPSARYWYADPFICKIGEFNYLFAEQYDRIAGIGRISVPRIKGARISKPRTIIKESFHLSFPNVFCYRDHFYMIPESVGSGQIRVYRMGDSVNHWELCKTYHIENSVDTAVVICEDHLLLFTCEEHPDDKLMDKCRAYQIDDFPNSEPVDASSILTDRDFSYYQRNAGAIFSPEHEKALYRVRQNSLPDYYGKSFSFYRMHLSETEEHEELLKTIEPQDVLKHCRGLSGITVSGTHTYNTCGDYEVIDLNCKFVSAKNIVTKCLRKLKNSKRT